MKHTHTPNRIGHLLIALFLLLGFQSARADFETGKVRLWVFNGTGVRVYNINNMPNTSVPGSGSGTARCTGTALFAGMDLQLTSEGAKAIFSKLLAAEVAGQNVTFWYTHTPSNNSCTLDSLSTP